MKQPGAAHWRSREELLEAGRQARKRCPRTKLATWDPKLRKSSALEVLRAAEANRVPELLKIKHERMAASPFGFFRGAVPVMAHDLSLVPNTAIATQLCGDAHVQNLGAFAGIDGRLIFDINDFDETIRGPFDWDVRRMTASILVAGRVAKLKSGAPEQAAQLFVSSYEDMIQQFSGMPVLEVARYQVHRLGTVSSITKILAKAQRETPLNSRDRLIEKASSDPRFRTSLPLLRPVGGKEAREVLASLKLYAGSLQPERRHFLEQFRPLAVAFKVVGTGSVGLRDYCVYLEGNGPKDPLFLQIKQEVQSGWLPSLRRQKASAHNGQRVAEGQRAMQIQSDPMLGWTEIAGDDYLVRQLNDHKASLDATTLKEADLSQYAGVCGELLARGHARSGDARVIAGYIGGGGRFLDAIVEFGKRYADQTEADWEELRKS